ncbi:hypothetical protein PACTADRAFT_47393 [Pachysolen tannophilus NRRL Y-2460]|uniref:Carnitine O-acetyltransferase, mitochondrial n=1 Tax=Pachysolen tannophilus NRRL Y-2460 TaxID=669874 RepID=A0A1E4U0F5_PACTA|nr:hypothetical protein PACTADRAFT_47393 [Pachysolen tannophilus NRRL Y-2460]
MPIRRQFSESAVSRSGGKEKLFQYQDELPALPVPELEESTSLYLKSLKPLYGKNLQDFNKTASIVSDFIKPGGQGELLQQRLLEVAAEKGQRNWLAKWWDNYAYLEYRDPVSPFVSYFYSHKGLTNKKIDSNQLMKASLIIKKTVEFMESIENETLAPEVNKNTPFCMESFKWMFNNCRVPNDTRDCNIKFTPLENRFLIVIYNDQFYKVYHHDLNGNPINESQIYQQLLNVVTSSSSAISYDPIGILTSSNRDVWTKDYKELTKSPLNVKNLREIHASSFVLCLDNNSPVSVKEKSRNCWHGNGTNRWFDKPVQFFVASNGASGFLGEHSKMDGTPTLRMNDWLIKQLNIYETSVFESPLTSDVSQINDIEILNWDITPATKLAIEKATVEFNKTVSSLDLEVWQYFGLGKNLIKKFKISPDAFIQMLIQLGFYKMTGVCKPTYESASTRKFFGGRTETCRSVSSESLRFVEGWQDPSVTKKVKLQLFREAIKSHLNYISRASNGLGCDRHFFGLKQMLEPNEPVHDFFKDPMFSYSSHWFLSTSQLSSNEFSGYGWAPVVPDGFGLAYMITEDFLHVNISCFKSNGFGYTSEKLYFYLTEAATELRTLLLEEQNELSAKL